MDPINDSLPRLFNVATSRVITGSVGCTAESHAKKAKAARYSDGASVLKALENLCYCDD